MSTPVPWRSCSGLVLGASCGGAGGGRDRPRPAPPSKVHLDAATPVAANREWWVADSLWGGEAAGRSCPRP